MAQIKCVFRPPLIRDQKVILHVRKENAVLLVRGLCDAVYHSAPSGCFDEVIFPDFGIGEKLPVGEDFAIDIPTDTPGEFQYSCGMRMFFGKVIIK